MLARRVVSLRPLLPLYTRRSFNWSPLPYTNRTLSQSLLVSATLKYRLLSTSTPKRDEVKENPREEKKSESKEDKNQEEDDEREKWQHRRDNTQPVFQFPGGIALPFTNNALIDAALTTLIGLAIVFSGGVAYLAWYKRRVLNKIELAFLPGYDPALELSAHSRYGHGVDEDLGEQVEIENLRRKEQELIDRIVNGQEPGHYFVLMGPKGSGKTTMILEAMRKNQADGVAICEAHPDLEVFRLRLGRALNFEYNEDSQTGLFQRRDPREGGPCLDIERAMSKLEKVALRMAKKRGRPIILVLNNIHLFPNSEEGRNLLVQLQQRAEAWCESGLLTVVFSTDDMWPYFTLRKNAIRMQILPITDLGPTDALAALQRMRRKAAGKCELNDDELRDVVALTGGRLSYLSKVSRAKDMIGSASLMLRHERGWLQSQVGLIPDCDDDVMDEQKWSSCTWLLLQEFVKIRQKQEEARAEIIASGGEAQDLPLPAISYYMARQIMTRADFIEELDRLNIISIDTHMDVRPDSMLILQAAREVVEEEGFEDLLNNVRDRIDAIESLHRTRELTFKDLAEGDLVRLAVDKGGARRWGFW